MKTNNIEEILKSIGSEDIPADVRQIAEQTSMDFTKTLTQSKPSGRRLIMEFLSKSQITRMAAAAVVIVAVLFALNIFSDSSVAWGEVLKNIHKVRAFSYRMKINMFKLLDEQSDVQLEAQSCISEEYGSRTISYRDGKLRMIECVSIPNRVYIGLIPSGKKYLRMTLTDELWEKTRKDHCDPRKLVEEFLKYDYKKLGRSTIDGVEVEGIECRDPAIARGITANIAGSMIGNVVARLWADV
jgi:hypothetical protein